jgi:hypothetical protein
VAELDFLVGEWDIEIPLPDGPVHGHATIERLGEFLVQRTTVERPEFPDSVSVLGDGRSHYFDSRGVARVYDSRLDDRTWMLSRADEDFHQRFIAEVGEDGRTMDGRWERSDDQGSTWEHDFDMNFRRTG